MDLREIDRLVAEKVMGWTLTNNDDGRDAKTPADYEDAANNDGWRWSGDISREAWEFRPSESIAVAWDVVEGLNRAAVSEFKLSQDYEGLWACYISWADEGQSSKGIALNAATAPLAICLAALKAEGVVV